MTASQQPVSYVPAESDLVPYDAVTEIPARQALVLAPHADDEVFGCGGAIMAHVRAGVPVHVIVLTDGAAHGEPSARTGESIAAAAVLGYGRPEFWSYPDRGLRCEEEVVQRVVAAVRANRADLVYAPSPWEVHPDHRQAAAIAAEVVRRTGARLAYYEVGAPLRPNLLLDITASASAKAQAMDCFESQLRQQDYGTQIRALNHYRSYSLPRQVTAAEAFLLLSAGDLDGTLGALLAAAPVTLGAAPAPAAAAGSVPLVSVLVRSIDREHLAEALDSVALQAYPNIEVIVVAAKPGHRPLPPRCGPFPLRLVPTDTPLTRSQSANRALAQAHGACLLFLDDDDWLMPGHVSRLADVLRRQPQTLAAYTGVLLAGPDGAQLGQVLDLPFDGVRQLAGNITPIHAVLFSRRALDDGCRFDEALDRYEDWDFWLQVARRAPMVHLPGVSAAYRIHQSSGVHDDSGPLGAASQLVYRKWQASWSAGQQAALMQRVWAAGDLEVELASTRAAVDELRRTVTQQADAIHLATVQYAAQAHELSRQLEQQTHTVAEQSRTVAQQAGALAATQAQLQAEREAAAANDASWRAEQARVAARNDQALAQQQRAMAQQQRALDELRQLADTRQRSIDELLHSTSWRLTAPLRWLSGCLRRH